MPSLSKSRFMAGLQCHKRLFLECFDRKLADPVSPGTQARFDQGQIVGQLARQLRPGGVLIEEDHLHPREALQSTQQALANPDIPALYEAAFTFHDVLIRVDILARTSAGSFEFIEVKSSTREKPEHKPDLGIQLWVLEGCGLTIDRALLAHINNSYVYNSGDHDVRRLFALADLTSNAREHMEDYVAQLAAMRRPLSQTEPPRINVGPHCKKPHDCIFFGHCHASQPDNPIDDFPRLGERLRDRLIAAGIRSIAEVPSNYAGLSEIQKRIRQCVISGQPHVDVAIRRKLKSWGRPLHFLDFETIGLPIPIYKNTRPYEEIAFQWSLHTLDEDDSLVHREYLREGPDDPRRELAESLLAAVGQHGKIVHYEPYEARILDRLSDAIPERARQLQDLKDRLVDLSAEIKEYCYHPAMRGSFSLKSVLPAFLPGQGYDHLEITDGTAASVAFLKTLDTEMPSARREKLRSDLRLYCCQDTEATVKLYQHLSRKN